MESPAKNNADGQAILVSSTIWATGRPREKSTYGLLLYDGSQRATVKVDTRHFVGACRYQQSTLMASLKMAGMVSVYDGP